MSEDQKELLGLTHKKVYKQQPLFPKYLQAGIWMLLDMFKSCVHWVCKNTCGFWLDLFWFFLNLFYYFLPHTHMWLVHNEGFIFLINECKHIIFTKYALSVQQVSHVLITGHAHELSGITIAQQSQQLRAWKTGTPLLKAVVSLNQEKRDCSFY